MLRSVLDILHMWEDLGIALGLKMSELNVLKRDESASKDRMKAVLLAWLQGRGLAPSWQTLCKALRDKLVERGDIANCIERNFTPS